MKKKIILEFTLFTGFMLLTQPTYAMPTPENWNSSMPPLEGSMEFSDFEDPTTATSFSMPNSLQNNSGMNETSNDLFEFYTNEEFPTQLYQTLHGETLFVDSSLSMKDLKTIFPNKCDILIDQIATAVRAEVTEIHLQGAKDIHKACPKWSQLSVDDRKDFYVALVTSMALAESSCNNRIKNRRASDGTAHGLWQSRKPMSPVQGAHWVMNQIENQIKRSGLLFWSNSNLNYWAVLNPNIHAHKVKRLLKKVPACAIRALTKK